ncbi:MAG TPA: hypothetical protein VKS00_00050 [Candidatus Acidoferrales bacterium]|nr:hypothetical protein [Candidatus Acidoferrales bacterium]
MPGTVSFRPEAIASGIIVQRVMPSDFHSQPIVFRKCSNHVYNQSRLAHISALPADYNNPGPFAKHLCSQAAP